MSEQIVTSHLFDLSNRAKKDNLIPRFAKVNLAIKSGNWKLHLPIARIILETEKQNKHWEKKKLKKEIASISIQLNSMF